MKKLVEQRKGYIDRMELKPDDYEIQRHIDRLDRVALSYEIKWGYNLPGLVTHGLSEKWGNQLGKLSEAITGSRLGEVVALVDGCIRGYALLEAEALKNGHKPNKPEVWDATHPETGTRYRFCVTHTDAAASVEDGVLVYSLHEVVRILETKQLINMKTVKEAFPDCEVTGVKQKEKKDE